MYDGHGDVVHILDDDPGLTVQNTYDYDEFGNPDADPSNTVPNNFLYSIGRGGYYYYDHETGLYYLGARYYDPELGRFISEDPAKYGLNWYVYCQSNPLWRLAPDGLADLSWTALFNLDLGADYSRGAFDEFREGNYA